MQAVIAQEMGLDTDNMLTSKLFYFAEYVREAWKKKADAITEGATYIGGV